MLVIHVAEAANVQLLGSVSCDNTRENRQNDHLTLHVPAAIWDAAEKSPNAIAWANTLCCAFIWLVRIADTDQRYPYLIGYDGAKIAFNGVTTFSKAAETAYNEVHSVAISGGQCTLSPHGRLSCSLPTPCQMLVPVKMCSAPKLLLFAAS